MEKQDPDNSARLLELESELKYTKKLIQYTGILLGFFLVAFFGITFLQLPGIARDALKGEQALTLMKEIEENSTKSKEKFNEINELYEQAKSEINNFKIQTGIFDAVLDNDYRIKGEVIFKTPFKDKPIVLLSEYDNGGGWVVVKTEEVKRDKFIWYVSEAKREKVPHYPTKVCWIAISGKSQVDSDISQ